MAESDLEIRTLDDVEEMAAIVTVFQQVWGAASPMFGVELLRAISHAGGYVAAAYDSGSIVGASFGFLARYRGGEALNSHITGILPGVQHSGFGRAMKLHQRAWAAERGIPWITWTFDPLVRRNAWFNIGVLGAHVTDYLVNFYGPMADPINADDESDRLMVAWPTDGSVAVVTAPAGSSVVEIPTPDDIVVLRRTDPAAAADWRCRVRHELGDRVTDGAVVTGFTRAGSYQLAVRSS